MLRKRKVAQNDAYHVDGGNNMISLGSLAAFEEVQAMIKAKIGDFLQAEQTLRRLTQSPSVSIKSKANGLLAAQKTLEGDLAVANENVAKFQSGAWSFGDIITTGDIGTRLYNHVEQVKRLEKEADGVVQPAAAQVVDYAPYIVVGIAALLMIKLLR